MFLLKKPETLFKEILMMLNLIYNKTNSMPELLKKKLDICKTIFNNNKII